MYNTYCSFPPFWLGVHKTAKKPEKLILIILSKVFFLPVAAKDPDNEEGDEEDGDEVVEGEGGPVLDHLLQQLHPIYFKVSQRLS